MNSSDPSQSHTHTSAGFWKSRAGVVLLVFLAIAGGLLAYEHRVHIFTGSGVLIALLALCVGMHLFMHGGHGGHGGHAGDADDEQRPGGQP